MKNSRGQKIKKKSSIRFVPLAQVLLDADFLDFVEHSREARHPRLFPHLPEGTKTDGTPNGKGYGKQLSKRFGAYRKKLEIEKSVAFHSFPHTISTLLAEKGVDERESALITGRVVNSQVPTLAMHYIHNADTFTLYKRLDVLAKFKSGVHLNEMFAAGLAHQDALYT